MKKNFVHVFLCLVKVVVQPTSTPTWQRIDTLTKKNSWNKCSNRISQTLEWFSWFYIFANVGNINELGFSYCIDCLLCLGSLRGDEMLPRKRGWLLRADRVTLSFLFIVSIAVCYPFYSGISTIFNSGCCSVMIPDVTFLFYFAKIHSPQ